MRRSATPPLPAFPARVRQEMPGARPLAAPTPGRTLHGLVSFCSIVSLGQLRRPMIVARSKGDSPQNRLVAFFLTRFGDSLRHLYRALIGRRQVSRADRGTPGTPWRGAQENASITEPEIPCFGLVDTWDRFDGNPVR